MRQLSGLLFLAVLASPVSAEEYVLTAGKWGRKQTDVVLRAGGTVSWSHGPAGIDTAISDNPDFLETVLASGAVASAARDQVVQWAPVLATHGPVVERHDLEHHARGRRRHLPPRRWLPAHGWDVLQAVAVASLASERFPPGWALPSSSRAFRTRAR